MNKTQATQVAKVSLSTGYFKREGTRHEARCSICREVVGIEPWIGEIPTTAAMLKLLKAEVAAHAQSEH